MVKLNEQIKDSHINDSQIKHSIVIPAYNEERRIGKTLKETHGFFKLKNEPFEIIVVNDGSLDRTVEVVKNYALDMPELQVHSLEKNLGKGAAVKAGFQIAKGEYLLFCDADGSTLVSDYEKLLAALLHGADLAIASREATGSVVSTFKFRKYIGRFFALMVNSITKIDFKDTQCGFKLFKNEVGKKLTQQQKLNGFSFDVELLYLAKLNSYKVAEIGVNWTHAAGSKVHLVRDSLKMFKDILLVRFYFKYS